MAFGNKTFALIGLAIILFLAWFFGFPGCVKSEKLSNVIRTRVETAILENPDMATSVGKAERIQFTNSKGTNTVRLAIQANLYNFQYPDNEQYLVELYNNYDDKLIIGNLKRSSQGLFKLTVSEPLSSTKLLNYRYIRIVYKKGGVEYSVQNGEFLG